MPIINQDILASNVTTPIAGNTTLFTDAGLAYIKQSSGTVLPIGGLTPSGVTPGSYTSCDLTVDANGIITYAASGPGAAPGGNIGEMQFNGGGTFNASTDLVFDQYGMGYPTIKIGEPSGTGGIYFGSMYSIDKARIIGGGGSLQLIQPNGGWLGIGNGMYGPFGIVVGNSGVDNEVTVNRPLIVNDKISVGTSSGVATLVAGTVSISTANVTGSSIILVTVQTLGTVTTPQAMYISSQVGSVSFDITSADATDTSTVAWLIIN
jgi:hypothetical protein